MLSDVWHLELLILRGALSIDWAWLSQGIQDVGVVVDDEEESGLGHVRRNRGLTENSLVICDEMQHRWLRVSTAA